MNRLKLFFLPALLQVSDGRLADSGSLAISVVSGVNIEQVGIPSQYSLTGAYPNPFNPQTTIGYALPKPSQVRLTLNNLLGHQVAVLVAGEMKSAGYHSVQISADGLASGSYLVRIEAGDFVATQQVVLLK